MKVSCSGEDLYLLLPGAQEYELPPRPTLNLWLGGVLTTSQI